MNEYDARRMHIYVVAREQSNHFARFYLNLRIAAFSFAILTIGAVSAFGWNAAFHKSFELSTDAEKYLRFGVLMLAFIILLASTWFEVVLSKRYKIAWKEALKYEKLLEGYGLHEKTQLSRVGLRYPARFSFTILMVALIIAIMIEVPRFFQWLLS